jgi:uncharacterized SAM-binding protein YcdF (DUF218 family)
MKLLIQLTFLWLIWLVSPQRWQRLLALPGIGIAICLISFSPLGVQLTLWGLTTWLPIDSGETVDAIVVLGRGEIFRDLRVGVTLELWNAQRAPQIFASGMMDARYIVQSLEELNVPVQDLSGEECSRSTQENALFTAALLNPHRAQQILLVTDAVHMLRSMLIFRTAGFQVIPHPTSLPPRFSFWEQQRCLLREYLALIQYIFFGEHNGFTTNHSPTTSVEAIEQIREWNCRIQAVA